MKPALTFLSLAITTTVLAGPALAAPKAPSPDKHVAAALAKAKACKLTEDGFDSECKGYSDWLADDSASFEDGKANAALVGLARSKEPKVRLLVAEKLSSTLTELDAASADTLLSAAEAETSVPVAKAWAELLAGQNLAAIGKLERAIAIAKAHKVEDFRDKLLFNAAPKNPDKAMLAWSLEVASSSSSSARNTALEALTKLVPAFPAETCKKLDAMRTDPDSFVLNRAIESIGESAGCVAYQPKLLADLAKLDVTKDVDQRVGYALQGMCDNKSAPAGVRKSALAVARKMSSAAAIHANTRYYTLSAVIACDPKDGKAFVAKFQSDADPIVAQRARDLSKP